jgi:hypothetical protein
MYTFEIPSEFNHGRHGRGQTVRVCHTFPQIAMIVAERTREAISSAHVAPVCRTAEARFISALLTDLAACSRPCFDRPADHLLRLRGNHGGSINDLRSN